MRISAIGNTGFSGIKLANPSFENTQMVRDVLMHCGVDVFGHKTYYLDNEFNSKRSLARYLRLLNNFNKNECGVVLLPWSEESCIISNQLFEQQIKRILDSYSIGNILNLGI